MEACHEPDMEPALLPSLGDVVHNRDAWRYLWDMLSHRERVLVTSLSRTTASSAMREYLFACCVFVLPGFDDEPLHRFLSGIPQRHRMAIRTVQPMGEHTLPLHELERGAESMHGKVIKNVLHLDFSTCDLPEVLPRYFPHLRKLDLSQMYFPKNVGLAVERLPQLTSIHCVGLMFNEADIRGTEDRLEELRILKIHTFPGLGGFHKLRLLQCFHCDNVKSLAGLESLTQLESLSLRELRRIHDVKQLSALTRLRFLELYHCSAMDLPLNAPDLEHLDLKAASHLRDLDFLANTPRLKYLNIRDVRLKNLSALKNCMELETLELSLGDNATEETLPDYSVLGELPKLTTVRLYPSTRLSKSPALLVRLCSRFPPHRRPQIVM
ncbi:hypothetical protein PINS_up005261 [Pythium insidiosum]|nr:hypothetical protein PINS_up005261 [Pythium insidiosum]